MINEKGRKDVHLLVSAGIHRAARVQCAKTDLDLSRATEALWLLWANGVVYLDRASVGELIESSQQEEERS